MLLFRSPTLVFALIYSIFSIILSILIFNLLHHDDSTNLIQLLIISPPVNCILIFLVSLTWIERRFRLSYIPSICLVILLCSSILLTIISYFFLSFSIMIYLSFIYHLFFSILFLLIMIIIIISYAYGSLCIHRYRNMMTIEQQNSEILPEVERIRLDKLILKSPDNEELILFMSILPGRRLRHDIRNIQDDFNDIQVDTIITLNEPKELSFMNMTHQNIYNMNTYSMHIKRANIEHIKYPIRDRFIPKSISDYIQFIYSIILNAQRLNHNQILVHCMGGMGRTGMTIVCLELVYEYIMEINNVQERKQKWLERLYHYPLLLSNTCRVCQSISNVRHVRPGTIYNPLQILFIHEFYARLKSISYMQPISRCFNLNENPLLNNQEEIHSRLNTTSNNHFS